MEIENHGTETADFGVYAVDYRVAPGAKEVIAFIN
jgi:hypothetical protein